MWLHKAWLQPGVGRTEGEGGGAGLGRGLKVVHTAWPKAETLPASSYCPAPITRLTAVSSLPSSVLNGDKGLGQHL